MTFKWEHSNLQMFYVIKYFLYHFLRKSEKPLLHLYRSQPFQPTFTLSRGVGMRLRVEWKIAKGALVQKKVGKSSIIFAIV